MKYAICIALFSVASMGAASNVLAYAEHTGIRNVYSGPSADGNCAILADGQVSCWGNGANAPRPAVAIGGRRTTKLSMGNGFACALLEEGSIWCWGNNSHGQLGDGTKNSRSNPAPVGKTSSTPAIQDFIDVAAGDGHVCAIRKLPSGSTFITSTWCWGSNSDGQIGNFNVARSDDATLPTDVLVHDRISNPRLENVQSIVAGNAFSCAELPSSLSSNSMACWGDDNLGELGNDHHFEWFDSPQTVIVPSPDSPGAFVPFDILPFSLTAGAEYACARSPGPEGFSVACWGRDVEGQLSDGRSGNDSGGEAQFAQMPQAVIYPGGTKLLGTFAVTAGGRTGCAMMGDLSAACWGYGNEGQLGDGATGIAVSPVPVVDAAGSKFQNFFQLAGGYAHFCGLNSNLQVFCWGNGSLGQLGIPDVSSAVTPQAVAVDATLFYSNFDGR